MYYPPVHVVNILQTFQSVVMRSRWTHHTSKYWPCSYTTGNWLEIPWATYLANKNQDNRCATKRSHIDQIYPSQPKESKQSTNMLLVCKVVFQIFLPSICSFLLRLHCPVCKLYDTKKLWKINSPWIILRLKLSNGS